MAKTKKKQPQPQQSADVVEIEREAYQVLKEAYGENILLRQRLSIVEQELKNADEENDKLEQMVNQLRRDAKPWWKKLFKN